MILDETSLQEVLKHLCGVFLVNGYSPWEIKHALSRYTMTKKNFELAAARAHFEHTYIHILELVETISAGNHL